MHDTPILDPLTEKVIAAIIEVSNTLGIGFLEKVYERALVAELRLQGLKATPQATFSVHYKGARVGDYAADILVEDQLILELKCVDRLTNDHFAQCLNYLRASGKPHCLLINFQQSKADWKRILLTT